MKKHFIGLLFLLVSFGCFAQTLQSPEQFLGYKIGTHYTPQYKILNYVRSVAQAKPDMVKIEKYGETYEGRDLEVVFVATAKNLRNLDNIRKNNLAIAGVGNNRSAPPPANTPAIV